MEAHRPELEPEALTASADEAVLFGRLGWALVLLGLALNPASVAWLLTADGVLEPTSRHAVWGVQAAAIGLGGLTLLLRRRLGTLFADAERALPRVFVAGVALRLVVFVFLEPTNNDPHLEYVEFLVEQRRLPFSEELLLGWQSPLYYLLAAPILALTGSVKWTQALSLALSILNLALARRFLARTGLLRTDRARVLGLLLFAFLPQLVLFSSFVSNDALALPLGTTLLIAAMLWLERPTRANLLLLGLVQGLGLLTKGSFNAFVPVIAVLIVVTERRRRGSALRALTPLLVYAALALVVGGYKLAENALRFGTPFVSNEEIPQAWVQAQAGTYRGTASLLDANVVALVQRPFEPATTRHSIPLLLYGTFWYSLIEESNFDATRRGPLSAFPRALYAGGLLPTALIALGFLALLARARWWRASTWSEEAFRQRAAEALLALSLCANLALVLTWGLKHDAWSFFQARLLFPSFLSIAFLLAAGYEALGRGRPRVARLTVFALALLHALFLAYFAVELGAQLAPG